MAWHWTSNKPLPEPGTQSSDALLILNVFNPLWHSDAIWRQTSCVPVHNKENTKASHTGNRISVVIDITITSLLRQNDVATSFRCNKDVIFCRVSVGLARGAHFSITWTSYLNRNSHCGEETVIRKFSTMGRQTYRCLVACPHKGLIIRKDLSYDSIIMTHWWGQQTRSPRDH